ncbi:MAG TPA: cytochrome c [Bryobacteraceae bacterium]|nr:cytochrome c [Bryobacteraceae bacterium]
MRVIWLTMVPLGVSLAAGTSPPPVTFHQDVLPVLQKNCQGCHRPGEAAPMSFLTYKDTRPWAKAIREAVVLKKMPPWFADPHVGKFRNDPSLSDAEKATLIRWADSGAPEGDPGQAPAPRRLLEGWNIGEPDRIIEMPLEYAVPASGTIEYTYFIVPTGFAEDKWVQMAEARPGNRKVVHHVIAFVREPGSSWLRDAKPGEPFVPRKGGDTGSLGEFLVGYAPGVVPQVLEPGQAKWIRAGSDIVLQMHYTANGRPEKDRTRIGFTFAKQPPAKRVLTLAASNRKFVIPPGAGNHRVDAQVTLQEDSTLLAMIPHMHLRGKSFAFRVVYPTGEIQELLQVPRYSFNWQLSYLPKKPIGLPKGSRIECTAYFDNSANNPDNPNPGAEVRYGDQSWEEMMFGFFDVAVDVRVGPGDMLRGRKAPVTD